MNNDNFNLVGLLKLLIKWRKHIAILTIIGAISSVIISYLLPVYYKSSCQFYVYNQRTSDPVALMNMYNKPEIMTSLFGDQFGNKDDVARIISIAFSDDMINILIKKYDLATKYGYDTTDLKSREYLRQEIKSNFNLLKNDDGSISLIVYDTDKQIASDIANDIVRYIEKKYFNILRSNRYKFLEVFEERINNKKIEYAQITDSINYITKTYGIYDAKRDFEVLSNDLYKIELSYIDYKERVKELERNLPSNDSLLLKTRAVAKGLEGQYNKISGITSGKFANIKDITQFQFKIRSLQSRYNLVSEELIKLLNGYNLTKAEIETNLPTIYILNKAKPANIKAKPIRWMVAVFGTIATFIISIILIMLIEFYQKNIKALFEDIS